MGTRGTGPPPRQVCAPHAAPSTAGGTWARTCRSSRCSPSASSRSATTTWRGRASGTRRNLSAGARTARLRRARLRNWKSPSATACRKSWEKKKTKNGNPERKRVTWMASPKTVIEVAGREVTVSNPQKVYFPRTGHTKLYLVRYYLAVADGALRGVAGRPMAIKRFVDGAEGQAFFQKRAPDKRPDFIGTVELKFPSGRTASEIVVEDAAALAWVVNLGCIDLNPHPIRAGDLDHPDELRVDLDPVPGVEWPQIIAVGLQARGGVADFGLVAWPKTSGSRGFHIYCRIEQQWPFTDVRRAAVALAREIERRAPDIATSKWWKEERHGVFVDYNQNAKDRTIASAYSVRPLPDARVSTPLTWDEVPGCDPAAFTIDTVPARYAEVGDPWAGMDEAVGSIASLLELAERDEAAGLPDAPWPPHFVRQAGEAPRVQPSKRRSVSARSGTKTPGGSAAEGAG